MKLISFTRAAYAIALAFSLSACGSSDDDSVADNGTIEGATSVGETGSSGETGVDGGPVDDGGTATEGGDNIDITDAVARVITSACNTLPVSDAPMALSQATATSIVEGQLVRGRIHTGIVGNEENYWTIDLPEGYHHVFLDIVRGDGSAGMFGITGDTVDAAGAVTGRMINGLGFRYRTRLGNLYLNDAPQTVTLRLKQPNNVTFNGPQDYVLGVFANGRSIPSPFFDDCPTNTALSVGTTASERLRESEQATDTATYELELARGQYTLASQARLVNGEARSYRYDFKLLDGFGIGYPGLEISEVYSARETNASGESEFFYDGDGPVWINMEQSSGFSDIDVEFTITPAN